VKLNFLRDRRRAEDFARALDPEPPLFAGSVGRINGMRFLQDEQNKRLSQLLVVMTPKQMEALMRDPQWSWNA
jgi:hypothetical protein